MLEVIHDGRVFAADTEAELLEMGAPVAGIAEAVAKQAALHERTALRGRIAATAGDTASLLGTTADGAQLALYELAKLSAALANAQSLAEVRAAAAPLAALTADFLADVDAGRTHLTALAKGEGTVLDDIANRSNAVCAALAS